MKRKFKFVCILLITVMAIPFTSLAGTASCPANAIALAEAVPYTEDVTRTAETQFSGLANTTTWYSSSWWNVWTMRNRLRTTRGATTTNNPLWNTITYWMNQTSVEQTHTRSINVTYSGTLTLGLGVTKGAISGNMSTASTFSRNVTYTDPVRVPVNRRVTLQTRVSNHTTSFTTVIQQQRQGFFQVGQWTNYGNPVTRSSSFTNRVPGRRLIETALNTPAPR